jgi:hypothetical protein
MLSWSHVPGSIGIAGERGACQRYKIAGSQRRQPLFQRQKDESMEKLGIMLLRLALRPAYQDTIA